MHSEDSAATRPRTRSAATAYASPSYSDRKRTRSMMTTTVTTISNDETVRVTRRSKKTKVRTQQEEGTSARVAVVTAVAAEVDSTAVHQLDSIDRKLKKKNKKCYTRTSEQFDSKTKSLESVEMVDDLQTTRIISNSMSSNATIAFDVSTFLPVDTLRIVLSYVDPLEDLSNCVKLFPMITSDRVLCREVMRDFAKATPLTVDFGQPMYHEQTLVGSICNNYPFYLAATKRSDKLLREANIECSGMDFLGTSDFPWQDHNDVSDQMMSLLRAGGMWSPTLNVLHSVDSARALQSFNQTIEWQTYARLAPYTSLCGQSYPIVDLYAPTSSIITSRSINKFELELWKEWNYDLTTINSQTKLTQFEHSNLGDAADNGGPGARIRQTPQLPDVSHSTLSSSSSLSSGVPVFRSFEGFLNRFDSLYSFGLWRESIDWHQWLCVGGSVLRSVLNPLHHNIDQYVTDPSAGLAPGVQDVDFFWRTEDFYRFEETYKNLKKHFRKLVGRENVQAEAESMYVKILMVDFTDGVRRGQSSNLGVGRKRSTARTTSKNKKHATQPAGIISRVAAFFSSSLRGDGGSSTSRETSSNGPIKTSHSQQHQSNLPEVTPMMVDSESEMSRSLVGSATAAAGASVAGSPPPHFRRIVKFNFIWYDDNMSPGEILNIFDLDICQVAFDGETVLLTHSAIEALRTRTMINYKLVNSAEDVRYFVPRTQKYVSRGFRLLVPHGFIHQILIDAWHLADQLTEKKKINLKRAQQIREQKRKQQVEQQGKATNIKTNQQRNKNALILSQRTSSVAPATVTTAVSDPDDIVGESSQTDIPFIGLNGIKGGRWCRPIRPKKLWLDRQSGKQNQKDDDQKNDDHDESDQEESDDDNNDDTNSESEDELDFLPNSEEDDRHDSDGSIHIDGIHGGHDYSGFLLNNDSMSVRRMFIEKCLGMKMSEEQSINSTHQDQD